MLHLFISCSINYPLCAELIQKQFTFNHSDYVYIIFSSLHVNHISYCCMSCILGWRPFITFINWINLDWSCEFDLHQMLSLFPWARDFTLTAHYSGSRNKFEHHVHKQKSNKTKMNLPLDYGGIEEGVKWVCEFTQTLIAAGNRLLFIIPSMVNFYVPIIYFNTRENYYRN